MIGVCVRPDCILQMHADVESEESPRNLEETKFVFLRLSRYLNKTIGKKFKRKMSALGFRT